MSSDGRGSIHHELSDRLWALGERRGVYEAYRYLDDSKERRERRSLATSSEQEAGSLVAQMNDELAAGGPATVATCFRLYKFHKEQKGKWTQSMDRAMRVVCEQIGDLAPGAITLPLCEGMIEDRLKLGLANDTVRIEMAYLRACLRYAAKMKRIPKAPFIPVPAGGNARERWLTQDEVKALIEGARELHVKLFIVLSVTTAARPSHVLGLKWTAVDTEAAIIDFRDLDTAANNKVRPRVPINATGLKYLAEAKGLARTEFVIEMNGKGGFAKAYKGIVEAARRAGIKGVSPYVLRHTAGVWMAKARVPMQEIAAFMGHKDLKTTIKHYAHHHPDFLRDAAGALEIN